MNYTSTRDSALCTGASTAIHGHCAGRPAVCPAAVPTGGHAGVLRPDVSADGAEGAGHVSDGFDPDFLKTATRADIQHRKLRRQGRLCGACGQGNTYALGCGTARPARLKDYALQAYAASAGRGQKNLGETGVTKILVATSGDTGKLRARGLCGPAGHPYRGVLSQRGHQ